MWYDLRRFCVILTVPFERRTRMGSWNRCYRLGKVIYGTTSIDLSQIYMKRLSGRSSLEAMCCTCCRNAPVKYHHQDGQRQFRRWLVAKLQSPEIDYPIMTWFRSFLDSAFRGLIDSFKHGRFFLSVSKGWGEAFLRNLPRRPGKKGQKGAIYGLYVNYDLIKWG